jgi:predicted transcriptional regulator
MPDSDQLITLTADIVSSHLANNTVALGDVSSLIQQVHGALAGLNMPKHEEPEAKSPIVSARASIKPDYLVCMECGSKQKTLKRHLQTAHGLSPDQYRADYNLPRDYPMAAPNYSAKRSELARSLGLGSRGRGKKVEAPAPAPVEAPKPKPRGRRKASAETA